MKLNDQKLLDITNLLISFLVISKRPFYYIVFNGVQIFLSISVSAIENEKFLAGVSNQKKDLLKPF